MAKKGIILIITLILAIVGLFYLLVPHEIHVSSGLSLGLDHSMHQILGIVLLIVAVLILWKGR